MTAVVPSTLSDMLAEIESRTAEQMLMAVGYTTAPSGPTFCPELDDAILQFRPHGEGSSLQRGDLVELAGASGSGKTTFMIFLLQTFLLPSSVPFPFALLPSISTSRPPSDIDCGGRQSRCIALQPTTHPSIVPRLTAALTGHIHACFSSALQNLGWLNHPQQAKLLDLEVYKTVQESLARLEIIRVRPRWRSWTLALRSIVELPPAAADSDEPLAAGLLVCDGFGDAYYPEKWAEEQARFAGASKLSSVSLKGLRTMDDVGLSEVMTAIVSIRQHLGSVVVLAVQGLWKLNQTPYYSAHLPTPYPRPFTHFKDAQSNPQIDKWPLNIQITLQPPLKPLQFPPESLASEALVSATRANLNEYNEFIGHPCTKISGRVRVNGPRNLAVDSGEGVKFTFGIGPEGMEAWS